MRTRAAKRRVGSTNGAKSIMVTAADRGGPRLDRARSTLPLNVFESGMRDAADATHALEGSIRPKALEMLLAFMCEGECEIDEGQLTEVLAIGSRLGGRAGGCKKAKKPPMGVG